MSGVVDTNVPGGTHEYRVIGVLVDGGGGGAGIDFEEQIDDPHSISEISEVTVGQGELVDTVDVFDTPLAVAFDTTNREVAVALASGIIQFFDENLDYVRQIDLPVKPFAVTEIRGIAFTPDNPNELFVTIENGEVYRTIDGGGNVDFLFQLPPSGVEEGYTGLDVRGDLIFITSGPGAECFIGLQISDGKFITEGNSLSELLEEELDHNAGVGVRLPDGDFLFGVGAGGSTIDSVVGITVTSENPQFEFEDAGINVPLDGLGSQDLRDIAIATGAGLIVADAWNSRVCLVGIPDQLSPSPQIDTISPDRGNWSSPQVIDLTGSNFGNDENDVLVKIDGIEVELEFFGGPKGPVTVTAPASSSAREVAVRLQNSLGLDLVDPGYTYGFLRGNANNDASIDVSDAVFTLLFLFAGGDEPPCRDAADADDSGAIDMTDVVYLADALFNGGPTPPAPFGQFGLDPTLDGETCGDE